LDRSPPRTSTISRPTIHYFFILRECIVLYELDDWPLNQELSADNAYGVAKEHFALNLKPQGRTRGSQHRLIVKGNITAAAISGPLTSVVLPIGEARLGLTDVICLGSGADAAILSRSGSNSGWDARSQYLLATKRTSRPSDKRFPVRTELDRLENGMEYSINPAKGRL
jgi:hypothetical protein